VRIVFAGNPEPAVTTLAALKENHTIVAVVTSEQKPQGRGRKQNKSPVAQYALEHMLPLIETPNINKDARLEQLEYDVGVVVAFGQMIGKTLLAKTRWMNVHYSLLPRWRGASPVQHALMYGDDVTGVTTFFLESELDAGPILAQATYVPSVQETGTSLMRELTDIGADLALQSLQVMEQGIASATGQAQEITYAPKLTQDDCRIEWSQSAVAIERRVRALFEKPTAFTTFRSKRLQLGPIVLAAESIEGQAGSIVELDDEIYVCTGSAPLRLGIVKPEGKSWMQAIAWWRGVQNKQNERFA